MLPELASYQYELIFNFLSFTVAVMAASTLYFWFGRPLVNQNYKIAVTITGLVTFIALYHYVMIIQDWQGSYALAEGGGAYQPTGEPFNDAYRYVDWLLTVPLLMIELILIMGLSHKETVTKAGRLSILAAIMVALGYPGEVSDSTGVSVIFWVLSMIPFLWIVYELVVGLSASIKNQPDEVKSLVTIARNLTIVAWAFYPIVYLFPLLGMSGAGAETFLQVGYSIADIVAKAVFGVLIFHIALRKTRSENAG